MRAGALLHRIGGASYPINWITNPDGGFGRPTFQSSPTLISCALVSTFVYDVQQPLLFVRYCQSGDELPQCTKNVGLLLVHCASPRA